MIIVSATLDGMVGTLEQDKLADLVVTVLHHHGRITADTRVMP